MKRSKIIKLDHDARLLVDACGISLELIEKMNKYGEAHFKEELASEGWSGSERIERVIIDVRKMLGMNPDLPITEYEIALCFHLHIFEANMSKVIADNEMLKTKYDVEDHQD